MRRPNLMLMIGLVMLLLSMRSGWIAGIHSKTIVYPGYAAIALAQQEKPEVHIGKWNITSVVDWQKGFVKNLLISNNVNGELRLGAEQQLGSFLSHPFDAGFDFNAVGAFWRANLVEGADLVLELRGRASPPDHLINTYDAAHDELGWGPWQLFIANDARSKAEDGAFATPYVLAFPKETRYLQLRATFRSTVPYASVELHEITMAVLNTIEGPPVAAGLPLKPIVFGPNTLTPRPQLVERSLWSAEKRDVVPGYTIPRGIILHEVLGIAPEIHDTLPLLRALANYQIGVLGWDDMAYHYLIDETGTLYEGRMGGPTSSAPYLSGGDTAMHIALIGSNYTSPTEAMQNTLTNLLAWVSQAYGIAPLSVHDVIVDQQTVVRQNIVTHNEIFPNPLNPNMSLGERLPEIRSTIDTTILRSRWYFPEGNVQDYEERLILFNPDQQDANVRITLLKNTDNTTLNHNITIAAGSHAELLVNDMITGTNSVSALVNSDRSIIAESLMRIPTDFSAKPGNPELSRIFYFPEGSTDETFRTYLVLLNPHPDPTEVTLTYMKGDGSQAAQQVLIPANQRQVLTINDVLPGVGFGTRIIASRPIAAARTMRFGVNETGMHIDQGITKLSRKWYFAEGTTSPPFKMRLLVLNPNAEVSNTTITFMTPDGTSLKRNYAIPPTTRLVVDVNEVVPALGVATVIESDRLLAVERALYFDPKGFSPTAPQSTEDVTKTTAITITSTPIKFHPVAGTVTSGATHPAYTWRFGYGSTLNMREYLLLSNPSRLQTRVTVEFILSDLSHETQMIVMPANSRYTLAVHDFYPDQALISAIVRSTQPIVAERSLFGVEATDGGSTSLGVPDRDEE